MQGILTSMVIDRAVGSRQMYRDRSGLPRPLRSQMKTE